LQINTLLGKMGVLSTKEKDKKNLHHGGNDVMGIGE